MSENQQEIPLATSPASKIREKAQHELVKHREQNRNKILDSKRFLPGFLDESSKKYTDKDITGISQRIKRKKHADKNDLVSLGKAFIQNEALISQFVNHTGALNVVIKEFTDPQSDQVLAAETLCNISLGNEVCCEKLANVSGTYLMIYILNPHHLQLTTACLWTIQNLVAAGEKPSKVLLSQELTKNIIHVLNEAKEDVIKEECWKLFDIILTTCCAFLKDSDKENILQCLIKNLKKTHSYQLLQVLYKLLATIEYNLSPEISNLLLEEVTENLLDLQSDRTFFEEQELLNLLHLRIIINLSGKDDHQHFIQLLAKSNVKLTDLLSKIIKNYFGLTKEILCFAANIYTSNNELVKMYLIEDSLENLLLPRAFNL